MLLANWVIAIEVSSVPDDRWQGSPQCCVHETKWLLAKDRFVASSLERTKHPSTASRCCSKQGALPEDHREVSESRIWAHVQAVQGQSESIKKLVLLKSMKGHHSYSSSCIPCSCCNVPLCTPPLKQTSTKHNIATTAWFSAAIFFFSNYCTPFSNKGICGMWTQTESKPGRNQFC